MSRCYPGVITDHGVHTLGGEEADVPEPVLVSIAAALAGRAVASLYRLVKDGFAGDETATAALEAAEGAAEDSPQVAELERELERVESADPEFGARLREEWARVAVRQRAETGGVVNQVTGTVSGKVLQARDIQGGVTF